MYKAAGTDLQELFRQCILGKQHVVKFNSIYVSVFVLYGSFLRSKILAFWGFRTHMPWAKTTFWNIINSIPDYAIPSRNSSIKSSFLWPAYYSFVC